MKHGIRIGLICLITSLVMQPSRAADNSASLATKGKQLFEDNFARAEMSPKWRVGKGFFVVKDGTVTVAENPDDHHGAYAYITPSFPFKDIVAEFSVKMVGARTCNLMVNDSKYKEAHAGHILKATVMPGKINLSDYKFGAMKNDIYTKLSDANVPADEKKKIRESIKDKSADFKVEGDPSQWHAVRVEIVGDEMLMSIDGKPVGYLKSEGINHPTKNAIGFEVGGKAVVIKDVKVWDAAASGDWPAARSAIIASLNK